MIKGTIKVELKKLNIVSKIEEMDNRVYNKKKLLSDFFGFRNRSQK
jgi:hypothetical protein